MVSLEHDAWHDAKDLPSVSMIPVYLIQYSKTNMVQFVGKSGENICNSCGGSAMHIRCPVSKVWEFDDRDSTVVVYHHGVYTSVPKANCNVPQEAILVMRRQSLKQ